MNNPIVTVLLPVYNAERYIALAVESILKQSFRDFELLIINDGSTDNSLEIIRSFKDERIRLVTNESNQKLIATLNKGIQLARGKYIARMDADDISLPERLQKQVDFMESHPEVGVCGAWFEPLELPGKAVKYPERDENIRIMMLYQTPFCHPVVMLRKEVLAQQNIFFSPDFIHGEDYEMWVRLSSVTQFANIPEVLLRYRSHESSVSASYPSIQKAKTYAVVRMVFEKTGLNVSDSEIELFRDIVHAKFKVDKDFIQQGETLLLKLLEANKRTHYQPVAELQQFVSEKWFHLCYNTTSLGAWMYALYFNSALSKYQKMNLGIRLKFIIKTMLRIK